MKQSTRDLLEAAAAYGKRNSGYGFSTAKLIREALENEDKPKDQDPNCVTVRFNSMPAPRYPSNDDIAFFACYLDGPFEIEDLSDGTFDIIGPADDIMKALEKFNTAYPNDKWIVVDA
jgi:hypothetical protein